MLAWESIQKTLDYIETHLSEDISVGTLARLAALSPFYYQRLFARLVKKPVREYVRLRRLAAACRQLRGGPQSAGGGRILDVALACGFAGHSGLTRAFKAAYGLTPEQYRKAPVALNQFDKPDLALGRAMAGEGVPLISEGLVLEYTRRALAAPVLFLGVTGTVPIAGQIPLGEATGVDALGGIWARFHREKGRIPRLPGGRELGVAWPGGAPAGSFTYFAGAEAAPGTPPGGFDAWSLPAREYVVCGFEAENFEELTTVALNKAVRYTALWLEKRGLTQEMYSPEVYYDSTPEGCYMELWAAV